ncbi:MAG: hypothetical protein ACYC0T_20710 [Ramlibacter sp.]
MIRIIGQRVSAQILPVIAAAREHFEPPVEIDAGLRLRADHGEKGVPQ